MKFNWSLLLNYLIAGVLAVLAGGAAPVAFRGCGAIPAPPTVPAPPATKPDTPTPEAKPDALAAIGRIAMSGGFCSGTVIDRKLPDGRQTIVTAAHCVSRVGERVTFIPRNGGSVPCTVQSINRQADCCILATDLPSSLPYTTVAESNPQPGTPIWHAGFGVDKPSNTEKGQVISGPNSDGQIKYRLSVSPGDSGGGIVTDAAGKLLSPVCCTTCLGCPGDVWGAGPDIIKRMIANPTAYIDLQPVAMPAPPKE